MLENKVKAVLQQLTPTTIKEVQAFLGFANFYRRFIKGYLAVALLLIELTKKENEFEQTIKVQDAFKTLKAKFTGALILTTYNSELDLILETDALDGAISGCLKQKGEDGLFHLIAYYSQKLLLAELNYNIYNKELFAIIDTIKH